MSTFDYKEALTGAQETVARRQDVITIAQELREGNVGLEISPVRNGFIITLGHFENIVVTKANDVGLLIRTLYSADLDNEKMIKRLRRMMGVK